MKINVKVMAYIKVQMDNHMMVNIIMMINMDMEYIDGMMEKGMKENT